MDITVSDIEKRGPIDLALSLTEDGSRMKRITLHPITCRYTVGYWTVSSPKHDWTPVVDTPTLDVALVAYNKLG